MKLLIEIDTENDAFQPNPAQELARILQKLAQNLIMSELNQSLPMPGMWYETKIMDVNGNTVGMVSLKGTDE